MKMIGFTKNGTCVFARVLPLGYRVVETRQVSGGFGRRVSWQKRAGNGGGYKFCRAPRFGALLLLGGAFAW